MIRRSVHIWKRNRSLSMEPDFWGELSAIANRNGCSISKLVEEIDRQRTIPNLSSAVRVYVLADVRRRTEAQAA